MDKKVLTDVEVVRSKIMAEIISEYSDTILVQQQEINILRKNNENLQTVLDKMTKPEA